MNELVKLHKCELTETSLVIQKNISFDEWMSIGDFLKQVNKCVLWWLGDWLNFGENKYGEKYSQALDETDYTYGGLANASWVSNRFEISCRHENLSWSHHSEVASLDIEKREKYLNDAEENGWSKNRLRGEVSGKIHVSDNSYEWYTPKEIIGSAIKIMGKIDTDPASCDEANKIINAENFHTKETNGLNKNWTGNVWLNPPYSMPDVKLFTQKAIFEYEKGNINQALVLVNNATDTDWFQSLFDYPICFFDGRVKFWNPDKNNLGARQGQAIFYLGKHINEFINEFGKYGVILCRLTVPKSM